MTAPAPEEEEPGPPAAAPRAARVRRLLWLVLCAYLAWGLVYVARTSVEVDGARVFTLWDDGMISMRYADHFVRGDSLAWNAGGERVQGYTNFGVTALMAGLHLLPLPPALRALPFQLVNLAALAGVLWLSGRVARRLCGGDSRAQLATMLGLALQGPLAIWALQGSDAGLATLTLLFALDRALGGVERMGRFPLAAFGWLAAGVLVRPDGVVPHAVFLCGALVLGGAPLAARLRTAAAGAALLGAVVAGLLLFGWLYYGDPLPNTYYLKATGTPRLAVLESAVRQLLQLALAGLTVPVGALVLVGLALWHRRDRPTLFVAANVAALFAYHLWNGGDWVPGRVSRFLVPAIPLVVVLAVVCARSLLVRRLGEGRRAAALIAVGGLAGLALHPFADLREWWNPASPTLLHDVNRANARYGFYLREHTRPDTSVAFHWGGTAAYFSERPAIDVLGRSDRHIARLEVDRFIPGHSKWDWDYVVETLQPDVILRESRGLLQHAAFRRDYVRVTSRHVEPYFARKDAVRALWEPGLRFSHVGAPAREWRPPRAGSSLVAPKGRATRRGRVQSPAPAAESEPVPGSTPDSGSR